QALAADSETAEGTAVPFEHGSQERGHKVRLSATKRHIRYDMATGVPVRKIRSSSSALSDRFSPVVAFRQESEQLLTQFVIVRVFKQHGTGAGARQVDLENLADLRVRPVGHHHYSVGEQN